MNRYSLYLVALLAVTVGAFSCSDDDEPEISYQEQLEKDVALIDEYLDRNGIEAIEDASGLRYVIKNDTVSEHPQVRDVVIFNYEGRFLSDDKVFEQSDSLEITLGNLVLGFQIGLQEFSEGTSGTLYIPSGLAYGKTGQGSVPPNANLIFEVDLLEVK